MRCYLVLWALLGVAFAQDKAGARYAISGTVTVSGKGQSGISVILTGTQSAATVTNEAGFFSFPNLAGGGNYTVMPSEGGQAFSPASQTVEHLDRTQEIRFRIETNLALGKAAAQSTNAFQDALAAAAVDGNTNGILANHSVTHTGEQGYPWWQVDLDTSASIGSINIWNRTDCCIDRLRDYWVFVSNTPFGAQDTPATLANRPGTWSSHQTKAPNPAASIPVNSKGRFVRVQLGTYGAISVAEVQVLGTVPFRNLATGKKATQSSTQAGLKTSGAESAVDGDADGNFADGSVTHTNGEPNAWWEVDLGIPRRSRPSPSGTVRTAARTV